MKTIFKTNGHSDIPGGFEIFEPSRGIGGTLAYGIKIEKQIIFWEMDDFGDWEPDNYPDCLDMGLFLQIIEVINCLEIKRSSRSNRLS